MAIDPSQLAALTGMYENAGALQAKQVAQKYKLDKASLDQQMKIALMESGDKRAAIEATREYQRGQLEQARQELERLGIPKLQLDQFVAQSNQQIALGELQVKQYLAQSDTAYKQGTLQQARDEMLQIGIPKVMVDRYVAEANAAYQRGELGLKADEMRAIGIPDMLTRRYSAEAQSAYQQGQLGLTAQQQQQQAIEQQRRYALDVARYGNELAQTPDHYFQAQRFAAQAPRLLGLQGTAGPEGGPTPGINQMGNLLAQATEGMANQASPYQLPNFPTMTPYTAPQLSGMPDFPTMPGYTPPPLGALPSFPTGGFAPVNLPTAPWQYPSTGVGGMPAPGGGTAPGGEGVTPGGGAAPGQGGVPGGGVPDMRLHIMGGAGQDAGLDYGDQMMYAGGGGGFDESGGGQSSAWYPQSYAPSYGGGQGYGGYPESGGPSTYGGPSAGAYPTYAPPTQHAQGPSAAAPDLSALAPDEQSRYNQIMARRAQLRAAGQPDSPDDLAELQRYQARINAGSGFGSNDPRMKQISQIAKASPPSPFDGLNESDSATLRLLESVYKKGFNQIQRGELERMGPSSLGFLKSAGSLLGYDPDEEIRRYQSYAPTQGAASQA